MSCVSCEQHERDFAYHKMGLSQDIWIRMFLAYGKIFIQTFFYDFSAFSLFLCEFSTITPYVPIDFFRKIYLNFSFDNLCRF